MEAISSSESLDLGAIRSRVKELEDGSTHFDDSSEIPTSDSEQLLRDCVLQIESKVKQVVSECSDVGFLGIEDLDAYLECLKEELNMAEAESAKISKEIEALNGKHVEDAIQFESDLEGLKSSLDYFSSQVLEKGEEEEEATDCLLHTSGEDEFEIRKLEIQIEKSETMLKSLQNLDHAVKRLDAIEQVEDVFSGIKVIEFDGTCIRLSLRTYLPKLDLLCQEKIDDTAGQSVVDHELQITVNGKTMELRKVEIFPNDIYISDIVHSAKSFRQLFSQLAVSEIRSPLQWFVGKMQDRIAQCTLRQLLVKGLDISRVSLEYLDRDETVLAHLIGGVVASIKLSQGWPISRSPLKLISLKCPDHSKEISSSLLHRVEEVVSYLDIHTRCKLSSFLDAIERALGEQMRLQDSSFAI